MKIAFCNTNGRELDQSRTCTSGEMIGIANILNQIEPHCCKLMAYKEQKKEDTGLGLFFEEETEESDTCYINEEDPNNYDAILVMNGNVNFFGGVPNYNTINSYKFLSKSKKPILYMYNDTGLTFVQGWDSVKRRKWNEWTEDELTVTAPFYVVSQFKDVNTYKEDKSIIEVAGRKHIDFGTWFLDDNYQRRAVNAKKEYDLVYGGYGSRKRRKEKLNKILGNRKNISVCIYGSMATEEYFSDCDRTNITFKGKVAQNEVTKTNAAGFATVIVGEDGYNDNLVTLRLYESMLAGMAVFIDDAFDSKRALGLDEFMYIKDGDELEEKILVLKSDETLYNRIMESQKAFLQRRHDENNIKKLYDYIKELTGAK